MVKGSNRCTLLVNVADADRLGLVDGAIACVKSRAGEVEAVVEVCDEVMPGVVSLPHGWGHNRPGVRMAVAQAAGGVSANDLTDEQVIDPISGNAMLNAVPVVLTPTREGAGAVPVP
jgi:anaerobic selenocysteine-containing dehydrogenase